MTLKSLLIANRGEIAIRIARAAGELGLRSVGIFSEDECDSAHLRYVDDAVALSGIGAAAYLDIDQIIRGAISSGVDAIHPGYGFLSENARFARTAIERSLTFVGPSPEVLDVLGDKAAARDLAAECGVPVARSAVGQVSVGSVQTFLTALGDGGAVMIKAIAGGGGRGIRAVRRVEDVPAAFERCRSEASTAFGRDDLYVEELLEDMRHLEVQVIGDHAGAVQSLGERECSLQRRHQKLVEIAPSPSLSAEMREQLTEAALKIARRIGYVGLGTFEFLVPRRPKESGAGFYFLEANPRLQVEHTVTEEVAGIDLVKLQLDVAGGRSLAQCGVSERPRSNGFAIQMRVTAEAIARDGTMRPATGRIERFDLATGPGVRIDTAYHVGDRVSAYYDPLVAKIVVHGVGEFASVASKAYRALCEANISGLETNLPFLRNLLRNDQVRANDVSTTFIEDHLAALVEPGAVHRLTGPADTKARAEVSAIPEAELAPGDVLVCAPMQGRVAQLLASSGDRILRGQAIAVIEAMKMEMPIESKVSGEVSRVLVASGAAVMEGAPILVVRMEAFERDERMSEAAAADPDHVREDLAEIIERRARLSDDRRRTAVERRRAKGGRTARENVADLCDQDSFEEFGEFALPVQRARFSAEELLEKGPADGLVAGIGSVNGALFGEETSRCLVMAYDYMSFAGTQGVMAHRKKDRLLEIAERSGLPVIVFAEGGGGRPGDGEAVGITGLSSRTFWRFARLNGSVPMIAIVSGRCFAGNAAMAGCCDVIIATENATIGMAGPAMIEGAGLGVVQADDIGPVSVQAPNGVIDIVASDEAAAVAAAKRYLSYFQGKLAGGVAADQRQLRRAIPENRRRTYDVRALIGTLFDADSVLELRRAFGGGVVTCLARVDGAPIGVLANDPMRLGGAIDSVAADKAARFMQLCDAHRLPLLSICDTPGFMVGPESEGSAAVRHMSRMFLAGARFRPPLFALFTRKAYGLGAMAMAGGSTAAPLYSAAWPSAEFGGMGPEGAVELAYRKELSAAADEEERARLFESLVRQVYERGKALEVATQFEIDGVIDPADTRVWLKRALLGTKVEDPGKGRRPFIDAW